MGLDFAELTNLSFRFIKDANYCGLFTYYIGGSSSFQPMVCLKRRTKTVFTS